MCGHSNSKLEYFVNAPLNYISQRIPLKSCYARANQVTYMNKDKYRYYCKEKMKDKRINE